MSDVSPVLVRLIAECLETNRALRSARGDDEWFVPPEALRLAAARARSSVARFPCAGRADVQAKLRLLATIYPVAELRAESEPDDEGRAYLDDVALSTLADILELMAGEGTL